MDKFKPRRAKPRDAARIPDRDLADAILGVKNEGLGALTREDLDLLLT